MVIADSCYSGTLVRAVTADIKTAKEREAWLKKVVKKRTRTALVSGGLEPVIDSGGGGLNTRCSQRRSSMLSGQMKTC